MKCGALQKDASASICWDCGATLPPLKNAPAKEAPEHGATVEEILAGLNEMIGQNGLKKAVGELAVLLRARQERIAAGEKPEALYCNMMFAGNPGTGKTTVARKLAALFKAAGLLPTDRIVEVDYFELVGAYIGQSREKTNAAINAAIGGVLYIDDFPSLERTPFGQEALDTLLKRMEDDRGKFVVIAAGYPEEMKTFFQENTGLKSHFNQVLFFDDYTQEELCAIFVSMANARSAELTVLAEKKLKEVIAAMQKKMDYHNMYDTLVYGRKDFINGHTLQDLLTKTKNRKTVRLDRFPVADVLHLLTWIEPEDIPLE
jgi:replication-associated recombination protein RarA